MMYITLNLNFKSKHHFNSNENEEQRLHLNKDPHQRTPPRNIKHDEMIPSHDKVDSATLRGTGSQCCVLPLACVHPPLETNAREGLCYPQTPLCWYCYQKSDFSDFQLGWENIEAFLLYQPLVHCF